jgi:hypothetical protein
MVMVEIAVGKVKTRKGGERSKVDGDVSPCRLKVTKGQGPCRCHSAREILPTEILCECEYSYRYCRLYIFGSKCGGRAM